METFVAILKYVFVAGVGIEVLLILRALFTLAREKARPIGPQKPAEE